MPREMVKDVPFLYRVKIESARSDGTVWISYNGPYTSHVPAVAYKIRVDRQQQRWPSQFPVIVTVERTACIWGAYES